VRKLLATLLSCAVLIFGIPNVSAAQKVCTSAQLSKINKLVSDFNENRSLINRYVVNIDLSASRLEEAQGASDANQIKLWTVNFNTATTEAKKLTVVENRILNSLKSAFNCSGYGTSVNAKSGYIEVKKSVKTKAWPASVPLPAASGSKDPAAPAVPAKTPANECSSFNRSRVYIEAESFVKSGFRVYKLENKSECVVFFNLTFDVYCPDRNTNLLTNPDFPYRIKFAGGYSLGPRQVWELEEDGFAAKVGDKCYTITKRWPNYVQFQSASPKIDIAAVQVPEVVLTQAQVQDGRKTCVVGGNCPIGSKGPGGGVVFYDAGSRQSWGRYLEVAPNGWSGTPMDPKATWCDAGSDYGNFQKKPGSFGLESLESFLGEEIGTSVQNTALMVAKCTQGAAHLARSYTGGGKSDWSLPSRGDMDLLFKYAMTDKYLVEGGSGSFWMSTESGYHNALCQFLGGSYAGLGADGKNTTKNVRPIRAF
jgi:hypothetical protein